LIASRCASVGACESAGAALAKATTMNNAETFIVRFNMLVI
jgi:hypothetical protein